MRGHRTDGRVRRAAAWVTRAHSVQVELALLVGLYCVYDAMRGLVAGGRRRAVDDAHTVVAIERHLGVFHEAAVQRWLTGPVTDRVFGFGYDAFHLGVTGGVLLWLYFRRRNHFARVRSTLLTATLLSLVGYLVFPTAPPRLAGIGVSDTLSLARETADSQLLRFLYNPYAAVPSLHMAFAVIAGGAIFVLGRPLAVRVIGVVYPLYVAAEVIATGNHFFFDVTMGVVVDAMALGLVIALTRFATRPAPAPVGVVVPAPAGVGVPVSPGAWEGPPRVERQVTMTAAPQVRPAAPPDGPDPRTRGADTARPEAREPGSWIA